MALQLGTPTAFVQLSPFSAADSRASPAYAKNLRALPSASSDGSNQQQFARAGSLAGVVLLASSRKAKLERVGQKFFGSATQKEATPFNPATQVGAIAPLGYFDPMEFCKQGDEAGFQKMRAYEMKHGRVAMMASLGMLAEHFAGSGVGSISYSLNEGNLFSICGICMVFGLEFCIKENAEEPGNFGDPLGFGMYTTEMKNKELSNGRMAMLAVLGIVAAELSTGQDAMQQLGLGAIPKASSHQQCSSVCLAGRSRKAASRLFQDNRQAARAARASQSQKAVPFLPAPEYWQWAQGVPGDNGFDPLNFWKEKDMGSFANQDLDMQDAEIKHGRLAMLAAVHWPMAETFHPRIAEALGLPSKLGNSGLNPSLLNGGLDDGNLTGFLALAAFAAAVTDLSKVKGTRPGDFGFDPLNLENFEPPVLASIFKLGEGRPWMAEAEITHGRLAMVAISAFAAQEKVSGLPVIFETPEIFGNP